MDTFKWYNLDRYDPLDKSQHGFWKSCLSNLSKFLKEVANVLMKVI